MVETYFWIFLDQSNYELQIINPLKFNKKQCLMQFNFIYDFTKHRKFPLSLKLNKLKLNKN